MEGSHQHHGKPGTNDLSAKINELVSQGKGSRIVYLSNSISGTLNELVDNWTKAIGAKHYTYESFSYDSIKEANSISFGIDEIPNYKIENADYVLSFGADFLETWLSPNQYARGFSKLKTVKNGKVGKFVQVEPRMSLTGASADDWVAVKPGTEVFLALGIANAIIKNGGAKKDAGLVSGMVSSYTPEKVSQLTDVPAETINQIAKDFTKFKSVALGGGVALTGTNATETLVAINILNYIAGNIGKTVDFSDTQLISNANNFKDILKLLEDMKSGGVDVLIVHGVNPVFTLPKSLNVEEAIKKVPYIVSFASFMDETTELSQLVLPDNHSVESWGDFQPTKSYVSIIQPAMRPVFNTQSVGDTLISLSKKVDSTKELITEETYYDYLRSAWKNVANYVAPNKQFDLFWNDTLRDGGVEINLPERSVELSSAVQSVKFAEPEFKGDGEYYFITYPSYKYYDGSGANKPWLQELPEGLTTSVWDSYVDMNTETAKKMGVREGSFINIQSPQGEIKTQVFTYDGIRPDTIAVAIGQGHTAYGRYAKDRGVNPLDLLPNMSDRLSGGFAFLSSKVSVSNAGKTQSSCKNSVHKDPARKGRCTGNNT